MGFEGTWWEGLLAWLAMTASWLSSTTLGVAWSLLMRGGGAAMDLAASLIDYVLLQALRTLYLRGPHWLGFWNGMQLSQICDRKTRLPAYSFEEYDVATGEMVTNKVCRDLINADVEAFQILALLLLSLVVAFNLLQLTFWYCVSIRPMNAMIKRRLRNDPDAKVSYYISRPLHEERRLGAFLDTLVASPAWFKEKVMRRRRRSHHHSDRYRSSSDSYRDSDRRRSYASDYGSSGYRRYGRGSWFSS